jgi:hypothetical protein
MLRPWLLYCFYLLKKLSFFVFTCDMIASCSIKPFSEGHLKESRHARHPHSNPHPCNEKISQGKSFGIAAVHPRLG